MSKTTLDTDIYGDIYGDEVELQDAGDDTQVDGVQDEDFLEPVSEPASPVQENQNKTLAPTNDNTHALPPKPSSAQNSLSYSAQIAQQFSSYQQTPSQERQQRSAIPTSTGAGVNGASTGVKQDDAADTVYGKKPSEMHDHGQYTNYPYDIALFHHRHFTLCVLYSVILTIWIFLATFTFNYRRNTALDTVISMLRYRYRLYRRHPLRPIANSSLVVYHGIQQMVHQFYIIAPHIPLIKNRYFSRSEGLRNYFQQFGKVDACTIMRDPSGTSRGFAFLTFEDENSVKGVLGKEHILDGKAIDPKRAIPREEHLRNTRFFVGGLSPNTTPESMKEFFGTYGKVVDATVMMDRDTGRSKGFGFVTYEDATNADQLVGKIGLVLDDKQIEVKAAQPRSQRDQARNSATPNAGRDGAQPDQMNKIVPNNMMVQQQQNQVPMMFNRPMNQVPMMGGNMNMMNMNPMAMMGMGMGMGGFNPMAMNGMNMMGGQGMQGMQGMQNMNAMNGMGGMPGMANMGGMRMGMGPMGMGMNAGMGVGGMAGQPNMGAMNPMGMGMRPNITSMGGGMRMGATAAGPGPARMSSRGQHNFHPYSR